MTAGLFSSSDAMKNATCMRTTALILSAVLLFTARPLSADSLNVPKYTFSSDELYSGLSDQLLAVTWNDKAPDDVRKRAAHELYSLLFQLWLVKGKRSGGLLDKYYVRNIMARVAPQVDVNDPIGLLPYYDGGTLNNKGLTIASFQPLEHADKVFENKERYLQLVAEFSSWRKDLK
jgi:hypothetical protein